MNTLGGGSSRKLEVRDTHGKMPPIESVDKIGEHKVRCWYPSTAVLFGKIGPISPTLSVEDLMSQLVVFEGLGTIVSVQRLTNGRGSGLDVIIGVSDVLPRRVAIANCSYPVDRYIKPPLCCFMSPFWSWYFDV